MTLIEQIQKKYPNAKIKILGDGALEVSAPPLVPPRSTIRGIGHMRWIVCTSENTIVRETRICGDAARAIQYLDTRGLS